jgi:hypothetical protein
VNRLRCDLALIWRFLVGTDEPALRIGISKAIRFLADKIAREPKPEHTDDEIKHLTGKSLEFWIWLIQEGIKNTWKPNPDDPAHPIQESPAEDWIIPFTRRVEHYIGKQERVRGDENIATAYVVSAILQVWAIRIARAKAFDPNRPVELRQSAYRRHREMVCWTISRAIDESKDFDFFPQEYENPFHPDATDGEFI